MNIAKFITVMLLSVIYTSSWWIVTLTENDVLDIPNILAVPSAFVIIIGTIAIIIGVIMWIIINWDE